MRRRFMHWNEMPQVDVPIVRRGGGASEDLWAFNEEAVVRAIVQSRVPVVSAVGHEIDVTLLGFCGGTIEPRLPPRRLRRFVPVLAEILARLSELDGRLRRLLDNAIEIQRHRLDRSIGGLGEMRFRVHAQAQHLDDLHDRMTGTVTGAPHRLAARSGGTSACAALEGPAPSGFEPHVSCSRNCPNGLEQGGASGIFRGGN